MSLYSIYFTQVLLPLLDLRYSQSHSNITIATENAFVLFFFLSFFRTHSSFSCISEFYKLWASFFVFAFKSLQLHILKKVLSCVCISRIFLFYSIFSIHFHRNHWSPYSIFPTIQYNINMTWRNYKWYEWSFCSRRMTSEFQFKLEMLSQYWYDWHCI